MFCSAKKIEFKSNVLNNKRVNSKKLYAEKYLFTISAGINYNSCKL